jgi:thiamine monophosphate synthase
MVDHSSLGLVKLKRWQHSYGSFYPTTCISGIESDNMHQILAIGITSIAVISALNDEEKSSDFIHAFNHYFV